MSEPEKTADGHHVIIDGRKWRATDPRLSEEERQEHVNELMAARRAVGTAKRHSDEDAVAAARARVHAAKVALGERGPKWWEDDDAPAAGVPTEDDATADAATADRPAEDEAGGGRTRDRATADPDHDGPST